MFFSFLFVASSLSEQGTLQAVSGRVSVINITKGSQLVEVWNLSCVSGLRIVVGGVDVAPEAVENVSGYYFSDKGSISWTNLATKTIYYTIFDLGGFSCNEIHVQGSQDGTFIIAGSNSDYTTTRNAAIKNDNCLCYLVSTIKSSTYNVEQFNIEQYEKLNLTIIDNTGNFSVPFGRNYSNTTFTGRSAIFVFTTDQTVVYDNGYIIIRHADRGISGGPTKPNNLQYNVYNNTLFTGRYVLESGSHQYSGSYPASIMLPSPGHIIFHNGDSAGGYYKKIVNLTKGPSTLFFSVLLDKDIQQCSTIDFVAGSQSFQVGGSSPNKTMAAMEHCVFFSSPNIMSYQISSYGQSTQDNNIQVHSNNGTWVKLQSTETKNYFRFYATSAMIHFHETSPSSTSNGTIYSYITLYAQETEFLFGKLTKFGNVFHAGKKILDLFHLASSGDYAIPLAKGKNKTIVFRGGSYVIVPTLKGYSCSVYSDMKNVGSLDNYHYFGVNFGVNGWLVFQASQNCIIYFSVFLTDELQMSTCKNLYMQIGSPLRFIVATSSSSWHSMACQTMYSSQDICGWLVSTTPVVYDMESFSLSSGYSFTGFPLGHERNPTIDSSSYSSSRFLNNITAKSGFFVFHSSYYSAQYKSYVMVSGYPGDTHGGSNCVLTFEKADTFRWIVNPNTKPSYTMTTSKLSSTSKSSSNSTNSGSSTGFSVGIGFSVMGIILIIAGVVVFVYCRKPKYVDDTVTEMNQSIIFENPPTYGTSPPPFGGNASSPVSTQNYGAIPSNYSDTPLNVYGQTPVYIQPPPIAAYGQTPFIPPPPIGAYNQQPVTPPQQGPYQQPNNSPQQGPYGQTFMPPNMPASQVQAAQPLPYGQTEGNDESIVF